MHAECGCTEKTKQAKVKRDTVLVNDRKKTSMDTFDPKNLSVWRGCLRGRLVKQPIPLLRKTGIYDEEEDDGNTGSETPKTGFF